MLLPAVLLAGIFWAIDKACPKRLIGNRAARIDSLGFFCWRVALLAFVRRLLCAGLGQRSAKVGAFFLAVRRIAAFLGGVLSRIPGGPWAGCKSLGVLQGGVLFGTLILAKPQAAGVQKSGTLRFLADDFFTKVGVKIRLSKNLGQATILGDRGGESEEFFWPSGSERAEKGS